MKSYRLVLCFAFCASFLHAQSLSDAEIKKLLTRIHEKRVASPSVQADFQEVKASHFLNKPLVSTGKVWFRAPNKFRREMKGSSQTVAVSNGHDFWIYFPNKKSIQHFTLGRNSPVDAALSAMSTALSLENVESSYQISGTKVDRGYGLQLLPRTEAGKRIFQRFDLRLSSDLFVEQTEMVKTNGDQTDTTYSNQSRAVIPASAFEFTPPAGTEITNPLGR
ncbi:MAG: outer membrane lipoprotein carrier protein LolA [Verrucomicrobia bacterium]|nr:outer membrane lipoprotein carrier protein LolA [Verrucomicrobiota bacterium]